MYCETQSVFHCNVGVTGRERERERKRRIRLVCRHERRWTKGKRSIVKDKGTKRRSFDDTESESY